MRLAALLAGTGLFAILIGTLPPADYLSFVAVAYGVAILLLAGVLAWNARRAARGADLPYTVTICEDGAPATARKLARCRGRDLACAVYRAAVELYPDRLVVLRERCMVVARSDQGENSAGPRVRARPE